MIELLQHPAAESAGLPLLLAVVLAGLIRLAGGPGRGRQMAGLAVPLAFLVTWYVLFDLPPWPPRSAGQKLGYAVLLATALGLLLDVERGRPSIRTAGAVLAGAGAAAWVAWPMLARLEAGPAALAAGVVGWRLARPAERGTDTPVIGLVLAVGLAVVAMTAASAAIAQTAGAVAAALGGYLLWNWPVARFWAGGPLVLAVAAALGALATQALLFTKGHPGALAPLVLVAFADAAAARLGIGAGGGVLARALQPVVLALLAAVPAALAIWLGFRLNGPVHLG